MDIGTALGIAGIAVTLPALAEATVQYGRFIIEKYRTYKHGEADHNIQTLLVRLHWDEIQATILFFASSCDRFEVTVKDLVEAHLQVLLKKFEVVILKLNKNVSGAGQVRRFRYALFGKQILEDLIQDLDKWQARFLQYLQLITFTGHRMVEPKSVAAEYAKQVPSLQSFSVLQDQTVIEDKESEPRKVVPSKKAIELRAEEYPTPQQRPLRGSTVYISGWQEGGAPAQSVIVDRRYYEPSRDNLKYIRQIVSQTARILSESDVETTSILPCLGFVHRPELNRFDLILSIPKSLPSSTTKEFEPRSLRHMLTDPGYGGYTYHSLSKRLQLAKKLASAVFYIHTSKLVHKNIRPENILMFCGPSEDAELMNKKDAFPYKLGQPVLVGFENVRQVEAEWASNRSGSLTWEEDIYQHPSRHGATAAKYYSVQHDVYSLGIVLIELALWRSFVVFDA
ncbi:uncharacterized protein LY89DRAFT_741324 [Mollisia scopiformis]|uniref:Protein kinase domain-containing protein n=1 Tax=Mollisia scopiformis TaxID=149040 RepID=A0A132B9F2_MOLSC|nr:uncharacterized protein LY89DRAFT_741324 [Mollisia scopiformis]KUJ09025.1 hypothetical protein LY89DRAFT_741324 [Mollisia scopiformis]